MDELIELVTKKAGISESQATKAVETVAKYLKEHLPEPIADQVDTALAGGDVSDSLGGLTKGLGGLLGKK